MTEPLTLLAAAERAALALEVTAITDVALVPAALELRAAIANAKEFDVSDDAPAKRDDGGPAHPLYEDGDLSHKGLSLRDLFAAHALTGLLAGNPGHAPLPQEGRAAKWAYEYADAMLRQRSGG